MRYFDKRNERTEDHAEDDGKNSDEQCVFKSGYNIQITVILYKALIQLT